MDHEAYMREALRLADIAPGEDEVPIGALVVRDGVRLGEGYNRNIGLCDPTAHAEVQALREACKYESNYRLPGSTLYVTIEPCLMCFAAIIQARVKTLIYGAADTKGGFSVFLTSGDLARMNHRVEIITGILEEEASEKLSSFFREKRERGKRKWLREQDG